MRNRRIQRELRRAGISKEEMLDLHDFCGIQDPTPYTAVKNIIRREEEMAASVAAGNNTLLMRRAIA